VILKKAKIRRRWIFGGKKKKKAFRSKAAKARVGFPFPFNFFVFFCFILFYLFYFFLFFYFFFFSLL